MTVEDWRPVLGREGRYEVSSLGHVRILDGKILGQWQNRQGYMMVRFSNPRDTPRVHRLVAQAFIANPDNKPFVNHIDCVRSNNESINLEWCTQLENLQHADRLGRMQRYYWVGKRSPNATLTDDQVREMRRLYATGKMSWLDIGRQFGVSKRCAGRAITKESYADVQ